MTISDDATYLAETTSFSDKRLVGGVHEETRKWSKTLGGQWVIHWRDTCTYKAREQLDESWEDVHIFKIRHPLPWVAVLRKLGANLWRVCIYFSASVCVTRAEIVRQRQNEGASDERKREMEQLDVSSVFQCAYVLARNYHYDGYCSRFHVYAWLVPSFMTVTAPPPQ